MSASVGRDLAAPARPLVWSPNARPLVAHACDDEFDAGALNAKWSTWDPAGILNKTVDSSRQMLKLSALGNGTNRWCGIYQAVPGSEFAVYAKVHLVTPHADFMVGGLVIATDIAGAPTTADFAINAKGINAAGGNGSHQSSHWTAYNSGTATQGVSASYANPVYLRSRVTGVTLYADWSVDGVAWSWLSTTTLSGTPLYFGLGINPFANGSTISMLVDFFRVFSGAGTSQIDGTYIGRMRELQA